MHFKLNRLITVLIIVITILMFNISNLQTLFSIDYEANPSFEDVSKTEINNSLQLSQLNQIEECFVPCDEILRIQVKDGITSIDNPKFINPGDENAPREFDKVLGIVVNGIARAYPYNILRWHEIVNDVIEGVHFSVTYSPLTASGISYFTNVLDNAELGSSGYIYENNMVFYDRITNTQFSQMGNIGLRGERIGTNLPNTYAIETTWKTWQKLYPSTTVLSRDTGSFHNYDESPYGYFDVGDVIYYQTSYTKDLVPYNLYKEKSLTHIVKVNDEVLLMPFSELAIEPYINHNFNKKDLFTIFSLADNSVITYSSELNSGISLSFSIYNSTNNNLFDESRTFNQPLFIDGVHKSIWNYKGEAISGLLEGSKLNLLPAYNTYWYGASAYFQNASIYINNFGNSLNNSNFSFTNSSSFTQRFFSFHTLLLMGILIISILIYPRVPKKNYVDSIRLI